MPFAPVVLKEKFNDYFDNPKNLSCPYMSIGFPTTPKGRDSLKAAIHPADYTGRPQQISREDNNLYYDIIKAFGDNTGVYGLLNTSFNLHGSPVVMSPEDALFVFENSGLDCLVLENFLILKNNE